MGLILGQGMRFSEILLVSLFTVSTNQKFLSHSHFYVPVNILQNLMLSVQSLLGHYVSTSTFKIRLHMTFYTTSLRSTSFVKYIHQLFILRRSIR